MIEVKNMQKYHQREKGKLKNIWIRSAFKMFKGVNRPNYHIVLEYFDIIEKTDDNRMVILKKKKNVNIPKKLIEEYELISK